MHMRRGAGGVLLSRRVASQVSSGLEGLTTVFGMGTGVTPPLKSPIPLRIHTGNYAIVTSAWGGDEGIRTPYLLNANQTLSQLSYAPRRVGLPWLEQGTSVLSGLRSNQLSYRPREMAHGPLKSERNSVEWKQTIDLGCSHPKA
jgi:hypothetical protein